MYSVAKVPLTTDFLRAQNNLLKAVQDALFTEQDLLVRYIVSRLMASHHDRPMADGVHTMTDPWLMVSHHDRPMADGVIP